MAMVPNIVGRKTRMSTVVRSKPRISELNLYAIRGHLFAFRQLDLRLCLYVHFYFMYRLNTKIK